MSEHAQASQTAEKQQTQTPVKEAAGFESAPLAANAVFDTLQQSIGNRALGRLMESQRAASNEAPTRVSPDQQRQIDATRREGVPFEGAPGVRMHYGENANALARGLNARAFTQGSDIFFGENYDPNSEAGQNTLAHELTHVAEGRAMAGVVQRDGPVVAPDPLPVDLSGAGQPAGAAPVPKKKQYTITTDASTLSGLSKSSAISLLRTSQQSLMRATELYGGEHRKIEIDRASSVITQVGGALTDLFGASMPDSKPWTDVRSLLETAGGQIGLAQAELPFPTQDESNSVEDAAGNLQKASAGYKDISTKWEAYKDQVEGAAKIAQVAAPVIIILAAVAIVVTVELAAGAAVVGAAGTAGAGAGTGGGAIVGGGVGGPVALGATQPVVGAAAGAAGAAAPAAAGAAAPVAAGAAGAAAPVAAGAAAPVAAGAAGAAAPVAAGAAGGAAAPVAAGAAGATTAVGVSAATGAAMADSVVVGTTTALQAGGTVAATEFASGVTAVVLRTALARVSATLAGAAMTPQGRALLFQVQGILIQVLKNIGVAGGGLPGGGLP